MEAAMGNGAAGNQYGDIGFEQYHMWTDTGLQITIRLRQIDVTRTTDGSRVMMTMIIPDIGEGIGGQHNVLIPSPTTGAAIIAPGTVLPMQPQPSSSSASLLSTSPPPVEEAVLSTIKPEHKFACSSCKKTFPKQSRLIEHEKVHLGGTFRCLVTGCGAVYVNRGTLTRHMNTEHIQEERAKLRWGDWGQN